MAFVLCPAVLCCGCGCDLGCCFCHGRQGFSCIFVVDVARIVAVASSVADAVVAELLIFLLCRHRVAVAGRGWIS